MEENVKERIYDRFRNFEVRESFPKIGDWHMTNAFGIYKDEYKKHYLKAKEGDKESAKLAKKFRDDAKTGGLAVCYGARGKTLASKLAISLNEGEEFYNNFFDMFQVFKRRIKQLEIDVRKNCIVKDLFERIRYLPVMGVKNTGDQEKDAEINRKKWASMNLAYNAPIQGSGATMLKYIMYVISNYIEKGRLNRTHGNLIVTHRPYTRIVGVEEDKLTDELKCYVEGVESGNVKLLVLDGDKVVKEYSRSLRLKMSDIKKYGMRILW